MHLDRFLALAVPAWLCLACSDGLRSPTAPPVPSPGGPVGFAEIQATIFDVSCAVAGCHDAVTREAGMTLASGLSYRQIVDVPSAGRPELDRIEPGDPEASYLLKKVRGDADIVGSRMPRGGAPLAADRIAALMDWILSGAPENGP